MPTQYTGLQKSALELLRAAISAHEAVRQGIATHAEKHHAARQAELNAMRERAELSQPLKAPVEIP